MFYAFLPSLTNGTQIVILCSEANTILKLFVPIV